MDTSLSEPVWIRFSRPLIASVRSTFVWEVRSGCCLGLDVAMMETYG